MWPVLCAGLLLAALADKTVALELDVEPQQGALVTGRVAPGAAVYLQGQRLRVTDDGHFVLGFERDAPPQLTLEVREPSGEQRRHTLAVLQRDYDIQRIEGVPQRTVTPPAEDLARIREEAAWVRQARDTDSDLPHFLQGFHWPLSGRMTSVYGSQRIYNGEPRNPHFGVDIAAPTGTPIQAPADGVVTLAEPDLYFSGGTIIIDHGYGVSSTYLHLNRLLVEEGDSVTAGSVIGEVGMTGRATGPHLCWRINWYQARLDPKLIAGPMPASR